MALALDLGSKAYMAGIIDMAGIIRLRPQKENPPLPYVGLSTVNKQVVDYLAGMTDSKVTITKRDYHKAMCTEHCTPEAHTHVISESYRWSVTGVKATVVLANIKPYLVFQTEAAQKALEAGYAANFKPATYRKMKLLGWDIPAEVTA
jgi:hypothetical protein